MNEKKIGTNSSGKVIKAGAGYIIGNYMLKGITFLSAPIFTRLLSTADYGEYNTYLSYEAIVYILVGIALHSSINSAKYEFKEQLNKYVSSIVLLMLISATTWLVMVNILFNYYKNFFGFGQCVANILIIHCLCSALLQIYNTYISLEYSVGSFIKVTSFNAIFNIIISIVLILTVFNEARSLGRIVGTVIPMVVIGIYIIVFFFKNSAPAINREYWRFGLKYSIPIVPHGISQVILSTFDRIMIRDMVGSVEAGIYSFAFTIYALFKVATTSLENVWKPWVYEKMNEKSYDEVRKQGTNYVFGMALYTLLVIMVAPELIKILGAKAYWGATSCVVPVVVGGYFAFLYTLPSLIEYFYGKTKYIAIGTMSAAAINIGLNYVCISNFGYIAAAYTTLVTYILYFVFHYVLAYKIHGSSIFDTRKIVYISLIIIIGGAIVILLEKYWIVRWLFEVLLAGYAIWWSNRCFGVIEKIKNKYKK